MTEIAPDPRRIEYLPIGSLSEDPRNRVARVTRV